MLSPRLSSRRLLTSVGTVAALLLTACGGAADDAATTPAATEADDVDHSSEEMAGDEVDGGQMTSDDTAGDDAPAATTPTDPVLASVATAPDGSTFRIGDFAGQTVFVETFATWCSTCRKQLVDTTEAAARLGDDAVFLVLSVETDLDPAKLAEYAQENGFDGLRFGVLDAEALAALNDQFGRSVLNAPSTPKFIVRADGSLGELVTGRETADEIVAQLA